MPQTISLARSTGAKWGSILSRGCHACSICSPRSLSSPPFSHAGCRPGLFGEVVLALRWGGASPPRRGPPEWSRADFEVSLSTSLGPPPSSAAQSSRGGSRSALRGEAPTSCERVLLCREGLAAAQEPAPLSRASITGGSEVPPREPPERRHAALLVRALRRGERPHHEMELWTNPSE
jgi:hypothetical protein